jgi:hypothetical protein
MQDPTGRSWKRPEAVRALGVALFALMLLAALTPPDAHGQAATGSIEGEVTDSQGTVILDAAITVTSNATGRSFTTTSTASGTFVIGPLAPGDYKLEAEASGWRKVIITSVAVTAGKVTRANVMLDLGGAKGPVYAGPDRIPVEESAIPPLVAPNIGIARSFWPKHNGVYITRSSRMIPAFPTALSGYRSENSKDFWGKTFPNTGSVRIFQGHDWAGIPDFPATMNGCRKGIFMIRWLSSSPDVRIESSLGSYDLKVGTEVNPKVGVSGYMSGTNCDQPAFRFAGTSGGGASVDVFYELKFWQTTR